MGIYPITTGNACVKKFSRLLVETGCSSEVDIQFSFGVIGRLYQKNSPPGNEGYHPDYW
jgi:hypothetical protein